MLMPGSAPLVMGIVFRVPFDGTPLVPCAALLALGLWFPVPELAPSDVPHYRMVSLNKVKVNYLVPSQ